MAQFGGVSSSNQGIDLLRYQENFGNLAPGTVYMDYLPTLRGKKAIDLTPEIKEMWIERQGPEFKAALLKAVEQKAALTTGSPLFATGTTYSGTSGSIPVLLPTQVDPQLYDRTRQDWPLASGAIPRVTQLGIFADIIRRTALPTAVFKAEGAALNTATSTYSRAVSVVKFIYGVGEITGPMLMASRVWQDALALETEAQFRAVKELEEDGILNGNPTSGTTNGTTTDENAFTGLRQAITTNSTAKSGAKISLDDLRVAIQTIREARGEPDLIVTDHKTLNDIRGLLQETIRFIGPQNTLDFAVGTSSIVFEGLPIIVSLKMPTSGSGRVLLVLTVRKGNNIQVRVMQEPVMEELAKTADSFKFMVKEYVTLLVAHENWCYEYTGLA